MKPVLERPAGRPRRSPHRGHGKPIGAADNIAMLRRMLRASYKHLDVAETEGLGQLLGLQSDLHDLVVHVIANMRNDGFTWEEIGAVTGVTRQAALMRWSPAIAQIERSTR